MVTRRYLKAEKAIKGYLAQVEREPETVRYSVFHARIATHGSLGVENCHPFKVSGDPDGSVVFHNGMLPLGGSKESRSDSAIFAQEFLPGIGGVDALYNPYLAELVESWASGSKLVIASAALDLPLILNEMDGVWENDLWYSNEYFKYAPVIKLSSDWWRENTDRVVCKYCQGSHVITYSSTTYCYECRSCQACGNPVTSSVEQGRYTPYCPTCDVCPQCGDWRVWCDCSKSLTVASPLEPHVCNDCGEIESQCVCLRMVGA